MTRIGSTAGILLIVTALNSACTQGFAMELQSRPPRAPQTVISVVPHGCVNTAPMPIIGLQADARPPAPPPSEYNMPIIRLSACYLESDTAALNSRIGATVYELAPRGNQR